MRDFAAFFQIAVVAGGVSPGVATSVGDILTVSAD